MYADTAHICVLIIVNTHVLYSIIQLLCSMSFQRYLCV
jgi:hypothetical protein